MNNAYIRAQQLKVKEAKFPFVKIGSQYWTTKNLSLAVTPQGNAIREVQANVNVEKIINGGFDTDTNWNKADSTMTISGGTANFIAGNNTIYQPTVAIGKWYKFTYTITAITSGTFCVRFVADKDGIQRTSIGTYTEYLQAGSTATGIGIRGFNATGSIDNVSVQEIGWSGSQELYDGIYAQTSGTVEQKTYAAVKAAAMWCHYNNDVSLGAVYGKLYNWFAVKLFQMDIDYYNAANPTKPYIWRIPTQAEFQTLSTYLGGDAVSGGKLKKEGLTYWNTPNTGADNSSGFCALGGGFRNGDGNFASINQYSRFTGINTGGARMLLDNSSANCVIGISGSSSNGGSVRLIKS